MVSFPLVTQPTVLHISRCLNVKHSEADCSRCAAVCPSEAIVLDPADVTVDSDRCLGCGLCLHECPAEVFESSNWNERIPLHNINELQNAAVDFFCSHHPHPDAGQREVSSIQIPTCLAALSPGAWFELGLKRVIRVRLDACAQCPLASARSAIEATIDTARHWLSDAGYDSASVSYLMTTVDETELVHRPVLSGEHIRLSRRGFFRSLFGTAGPGPDDPWVSSNSASIGQESPKNAPHLPSWMERAAQVYAQSARPAAVSTATWPSISVTDDCVSCNACTDHCPTHALEARYSGNTYDITFKPGQCVDCRICWASCPVGAITRSQELTREPFQRQPVLQRETAPCIRCGRPAQVDHTECYWCSTEPSLASVLTDARQWLFSTSHPHTADPIR